MTSRRFPGPWTVEQTPGGFKVLDANGQAIAYVCARETSNEANIASVLTMDEARRIAVNVAKLPELAKVDASTMSDEELAAIAKNRAEFDARPN
jgi:hypothetical protein